MCKNGCTKPGSCSTQKYPSLLVNNPWDIKERPTAPIRRFFFIWIYEESFWIRFFVFDEIFQHSEQPQVLHNFFSKLSIKQRLSHNMTQICGQAWVMHLVNSSPRYVCTWIEVHGWEKNEQIRSVISGYVKKFLLFYWILWWSQYFSLYFPSGNSLFFFLISGCLLLYICV